MAEKIFDAQVNYGWGLSLNMTGKAPAVAKRIFNTYSDALAYVNDFNDSAIEGLNLSVVADSDPRKNGVYFVEKVGTSEIKIIEGVETTVAKNDGSLVRVGGTDTEVVKNYSAAVALSKHLVVGQLIYIQESETIKDSNEVEHTYKTGFYIVNGPESISALETTSGSTDELGALTSRVTTLEGNRVKTTDFETYKTEVSGALDSKADLTEFNTHKNNANIHVTVEDKAKWNLAEENAKSYTAEEIAKLSNVYDEKGAAQTALTSANSYSDEKLAEAKAYTDGKVDGKFDAIGSAAAVATDLNSHTSDTDIHITAAERKDWNDAKTAIDAFLNDAGFDEDSKNVIDTLKELQSYIESDGSAATQLMGRVSALEQTKDDYIAADATLESKLQKYTDDKDSAMNTRVEALESTKDDYIAADTTLEDKLKKYADEAKAAAQQHTEDKIKELSEGVIADHTAALEIINGNEETEGSIAKAKADAIAAATTKVDELAAVAATKEELSAAQTAAEEYTDKAIENLDLSNTYEAKGTAASLDLVLETNLKSYSDQSETDAIAASNEYAKTYTDTLFDMINFAGETDIDGMFSMIEGEE